MKSSLCYVLLSILNLLKNFFRPEKMVVVQREHITENHRPSWYPQTVSRISCYEAEEFALEK